MNTYNTEGRVRMAPNMNFPIIPHMNISYLYKRCDLLGGNNWEEDPRRRREEEAPCLSDTHKDFLFAIRQGNNFTEAAQVQGNCNEISVCYTSEHLFDIIIPQEPTRDE
jgi:hypothetical protein